jgi:type II secretory pathway pseudopilin PulG
LSASGVIRTLSANNPDNYAVVQGVVYVPEIAPSSACDNSTIHSLLPANVTTKADIVPFEGRNNFPLIGLAPWTTDTPACVEYFLGRMTADGVHGAIFFHPGADSEQPPSANDPSWNLGRGGHWKAENPYPIYAVPGMLGAFLLDRLAQYSGNMSQVPYGAQLVDMYDPRDAVRLFARMDVATGTGIPSLWVFLIIVLAILLAVVLATSIVMNVVQRRQRRHLQTRVARGDVDLEALGIKRLSVPQNILDDMPQYTYVTDAEVVENDATGKRESDESDKVVDVRQEKDTTSAKKIESQVTVRKIPFTQSTCPICLDDFVAGETTVRELPCNHIFHPECIDPFLRDNSSLCPMCKKSTLPAGYCPVQVTNMMVRRERLIRRTRRRNAASRAPGTGTTITADRLPAPIVALNRTVRRLSAPLPQNQQRRGSSAGNSPGSEMQSLEARGGEMQDDEIPADVRAQGVSARRAWRRERLAQQQGRQYNEQANEAQTVDISRPLCKSFSLCPCHAESLTLEPGRRIVGRVIPSLE